MDIESDSSSDADNGSNRENEEENLINKGDWNLSFIEEKNFWMSNEVKQLSFAPNKCQLCSIGTFEIKETTNQYIKPSIFKMFLF